MIRFDPGTKQLYFCDGSKWIVSLSTTLPSGTDDKLVYACNLLYHTGCQCLHGYCCADLDIVRPHIDYSFKIIPRGCSACVYCIINLCLSPTLYI